MRTPVVRLPRHRVQNAFAAWSKGSRCRSGFVSTTIKYVAFDLSSGGPRWDNDNVHAGLVLSH